MLSLAQYSLASAESWPETPFIPSFNITLFSCLQPSVGSQCVNMASRSPTSVFTTQQRWISAASSGSPDTLGTSLLPGTPPPSPTTTSPPQHLHRRRHHRSVTTTGRTRSSNDEGGSSLYLNRRVLILGLYHEPASLK